MSLHQDGFPKVFGSIRRKWDFTVTTLVRTYDHEPNGVFFPFPQIDYLWEPAISVGEKQERSNMRHGEE